MARLKVQSGGVSSTKMYLSIFEKNFQNTGTTEVGRIFRQVANGLLHIGVFKEIKFVKFEFPLFL
jgi:hypothetical protein